MDSKPPFQYAVLLAAWDSSGHETAIQRADACLPLCFLSASRGSLLLRGFIRALFPLLALCSSGDDLKASSTVLRLFDGTDEDARKARRSDFLNSFIEGWARGRFHWDRLLRPALYPFTAASANDRSFKAQTRQRGQGCSPVHANAAASEGHARKNPKPPARSARGRASLLQSPFEDLARRRRRCPVRLASPSVIAISFK